MQHEYFSSFNQSHHYFPAMPLLLASSLLEFPIANYAEDSMGQPRSQRVFQISDSGNTVADEVSRKHTSIHFIRVSSETNHSNTTQMQG